MKYLSALVFTAGAVTLGMELSASRLLEPAFGNSQIVWAALIGLILLYLSVGAWLGGKLADRYPRQRELDYTMSIAAVGVALAPTFARPVLRMAATGIEGFAVGLLAGSLLAVLLLFSLPGILLGTASPWAIRLTVHDLQHTGRTSGRLYAIATIGSLFGTFLPVLWLIPTVGTRWTFYILSWALLAVVALGSLRQPHRWAPWLAATAVLALAVLARPGSALRAGWGETAGQILYEDESLHNYIAVRQWGSERHLKLNEGIGLHSVYHPDMLMSEGIWDYFLLAPHFDEPPAVAEEYRMLLIGLAAGTVSELFTNVYGPIAITGIELDSQIIEVGRLYFGMNQPNLTAIAADGRRWLAQQPPETRWDLIAIDAYRPPYLPFHLTTVEFFALVRDHLSQRGVVAINVGRTATNFTLVDALAATAGQVFPSVYLIDEPGPPDTLANSLLVATIQPTSLASLASNLASLPESLPVEFRTFAAEAQKHTRTASPPPTAPILTDDHAPVERIVHSIVLDFLRTPGETAP